MSDYQYISQRPAAPAAPVGPITVEEQLRVLAEEHGIYANFPDFAEYICTEFGRSYVEAHPYAVILTTLGSSREVAGKLLPCSDQLVLVDTEEFESAQRYEELLQEMARISGGGFPLQNLNINWEIKHKKIKNMAGISYDLYGKRCGCTIYKRDGWLYLWLISHCNTDLHSLGHAESFFVSIPDQTMLLFFGSPEQAKSLNHLMQLPPFQYNAWGAIVMPW